MKHVSLISTTRLERLRLTNYRCFPFIEVTFDPKLTVIVAPNGSGKTAILDAVAVTWRLFVDTLQAKQGSNGFAHSDVRLKLSAARTMEPMLPTSLTAYGCVADRALSWSRQLDSTESRAKTTIADASLLKDAGQALRVHLQNYVDDKRTDSPTLPLVAYYGTGRLFGAHRKKPDVENPTSRLHGYGDCLISASRYKHFEDWFERFSREAQQERIDGQSAGHSPQEKLQAVKEAVDTLLAPSGWRSLAWSFAQNEIVATHPEHGTLPVDQLSDGIRNMIGMVGDIAHRCTRLNPQFGAVATTMTPGIVLIDEVDMHLHPEWQQTVIQSLSEAFPLIQFIVTTHSPQVITTVKRENIRMLGKGSRGEWEALPPPQEVKGVESAVALNDVMKVNPIPPVVAPTRRIHP
jgi:predicted ATP-binding protein involved in virulence